MLYKVFISLFLFISFCKTQTLPPESEYDVISDLGPEDCKKGWYYQNPRGNNPDDYIPGCVQRQGIEEVCGGKKKICAPGLKCQDEKCQLDPTACMRYTWQDIPDNVWKPTCLDDGTYEPKQCKGESENGRCFCYDAYGKRIFGQEWSDKADDMTCACSRRRSDLERAGRKNVTLHCDSIGNYEPLQCDSGLCWCVEPKTGEVLVQMVPETMMTFLPCYDKTKIGDQYLRQCESQALAQAQIAEELYIHGTKQVPLPFLICDYDGSYGKFLIKSGIATCTLRNNKPAGSWATPVVANIQDIMDCNCARDTIMYQEMGQTPTILCEANGNYKKIQHGSTGSNYCVDSDGFPTTDPVDTNLNDQDCPVY